VASIALDDYDVKARAPLSVHPAFPAIVALWFSALLGAGSLVLPSILIERVVLMTGIASLIPAAAPPLGMTARGSIALAAALLGAVVGLAIARRIAAAHAAAPASRVARPNADAPRPLSVKDELRGQRPITGQSVPMSMDRAIAISEDDRPSDVLYRDPLPDQVEGAPQVPPLTVPGYDDTLEAPLELCTPVADVHEEAMAPVQADWSAEECAMSERQEFQPVSPFERFDAPEPEAELDTKIEQFKYVPEPLPFSAPSRARQAPEPAPEPQVPNAPRAVVEPVPAAPPTDAAPANWEDTPLEGLGLVQLVQRLGSTIERRREWVASGAAAVAPASAQAAPVDFEAAPAAEAARATAAYFGSPQAEAFPSRPQPAPHDADTALRAALATLQQVSGAA